METKIKKITLATLKSFIRKNDGALVVNVKSCFDGMTDGCEEQNDGFLPAGTTDRNVTNNLGIPGVWVVRGSRDYLTAYDDGTYTGIYVSNCCGRFVVAIKK